MTKRLKEGESFMVDNILLDMLRKLYGKPPYNNFTNICYGDWMFKKSIENKYTKEEIKQAMNIIERE